MQELDTEPRVETFRMHEYVQNYANNTGISPTVWSHCATPGSEWASARAHVNTILGYLRKLPDKVHQSLDFGPFSVHDTALISPEVVTHSRT